MNVRQLYSITLGLVAAPLTFPPKPDGFELEPGRCWRTQKNGQQSLGRSRGGLSTKIHAAVDGQGNLVRFRLTGSERHDITEAANLIDGMDNVGAVVADKAFDAPRLLDRI